MTDLGKNRRPRVIDTGEVAEGGAVIVTTASNIAPPAPAKPPPPTDLALSSTLSQSDRSATAAITATWTPPGALEPHGYLVQYALDSGFTSGVGGFTVQPPGPGENPSAYIGALKPNTTYYVRVAAKYYEAVSDWTAAVSTTTPQDTTPPAAPSAPAASFDSAGNLTVTWTNPTDANFWRTEVVVKDSSVGTTYLTEYVAGGSRFVFSREQNAALANNDPSLYVQLRAQSWSGYFSTSVNASATKAVPSTPGSVTATWDAASGMLRIAWAAVTGASYYSLTLDGITRTTTDIRYEYSAAQNRMEHSGTADPAIAYSLTAVDGLGQASTAATGTATLAAPSTPTGVAADFAGPDALFTWTASASVAYYRLTLDTVARDVFGARYTYTYGQNAAEHSGTADPVLTYSLVAVDGLGQVSTAASGTATNAAPSAPSAVTVIGYFSTLGISVTATQPSDFATYRYRLIQTSPSASDITFDSAATAVTRSISASATYQVGVKVVDMFGQASTETLSSALAVETLTLADLRADVIYSDSGGTAAATLKAALADDNQSSGGVSYASNAGWVRWVRFERPNEERYKTLTVSMAPTSGTTNWYVRTSTDGSTWSYFSGPVTSSRILTSVASASAAQTAAIASSTLGSSSASRADLPTIEEARFVELWLRNTAASTRLDEFYPRRLVQSDDIEAESIKAINIGAATITGDRIAASTITAGNIAASTITADKLSVSQLSAITADMGTLTAGTVTGATIRTASSGARVEMNSTGILGTDGTTTQWSASNSGSGKLTAGGGNVALDSAGIGIVASTSMTDARAYKFTNTGGSVSYGGVYAQNVSSTNYIAVGTNAVAATNSQALILSSAPATYLSEVKLDAGGVAQVSLQYASTGTKQLIIGNSGTSTGPDMYVYSGFVAIPGFLRPGGTAFPASPATNDVFYRTDLDWWCVYDGTRWLTTYETAQQIMPWTSYNAAANIDAVLRTDVAPYVTRVAVVTYVATTNTAANYWTVTTQGVNGGKTAATTVQTFTTASDPVNTFTTHEGAPSTANPTNRTYWRVALAKTGAPGNIFVSVTLYYRYIVT